MTFANPIYLWGLLGLAVPVAIHLWSKKEGKTIQIGSIQLLTEANPKQASSIQLNEFFLLFLRLLILALLAFILAGPQLKQHAERVDLVYLIEPGLLENKNFQAMIDSLPEEKIHILQPDFPKWERDETVKKPLKTPNYWQLAMQMERLHADSVVVFTRALLNGIHGKRPAINTTINWVVLNPETVKNQSIFARKQGDSIEIVSVDSDNGKLTFSKEKIGQNSSEISLKPDSISLMRNGKTATVPLKIQDTLQVQLTASDSLEAEKKYIAASFRALSKYIGLPLKILEVGDTPNPKTDILIWLKNEQIPEFSGTVLTYKSDKYAQNLVGFTENPSVFQLTGALNSENSVTENLPEQLLKMLKLHPDLNLQMERYDLRSISKNELKTQKNDRKMVKNYAQSIDLSPWFWGALSLIFITERITAFYRKQ